MFKKLIDIDPDERVKEINKGFFDKLASIPEDEGTKKLGEALATCYKNSLKSHVKLSSDPYMFVSEEAGMKDIKDRILNIRIFDVTDRIRKDFLKNLFEIEDPGPKDVFNGIISIRKG